LAKTIDAPWRRYIDRKVIHFFYFYLLWAAIQLTMKIGTLPDPSLFGLVKAFGWALVDPITPLWFIYLLPIFFVATRLLKPVPWPLVMVAAGLMEAFHLTNQGMIAYEFTYRFVYFYAGYRFAPLVFRFAQAVAAYPALTLAGLGLWGVVNALAVFKFSVGGEPLSQYPGVGLVLGFAGALAIVAIAVLLSRFEAMRFLNWLGEHSLIMFTAFVLFMAPTRIVMLKQNIVTDIGTISIIVTMASLIGPLILYAIVRRTRFMFLFERPKWARLKGA
ncbi:MAG: acyltransferase, partial [Hyphomicrobiales bacterium]|nr:acyltransferase [Hyphomicrobiales bacterium]